MRSSLLHFLLSLSFSFLLCLAVPVFAEVKPSDDLSELVDNISISQGWGNPGINTAAWMAEGSQQPLRIGDTVFEKGIGTHAQGAIRIPLNKGYNTFSAKTGVQWQGGGKGSVVFEVQVDGKSVYTGKAMSDSDTPAALHLSVQGADELLLLSHDNGDGISCDMANWVDAQLIRDTRVPVIGVPVWKFGSKDASPLAEMEGSFALAGQSGNAQAAFCVPLHCATLFTSPGQDIAVSFPLARISESFTIEAQLQGVGTAKGIATLSLASGETVRQPLTEDVTTLTVRGNSGTAEESLTLTIQTNCSALVRLKSLTYSCDGIKTPLPFFPPQRLAAGSDAPPAIAMQPLLEQEIIEWDWHMQDGIGAGATRNSYADAIKKALASHEHTPVFHEEDSEYLSRCFQELTGKTPDDAPAWEILWRCLHQKKRDFFLAQMPSGNTPLLFVKHAPGGFSHQLTQYYGRYARPGGGVFVLEAPGASMKVRALAESHFPDGSFMHPEISTDGERILVAFCATEIGAGGSFDGNPGHFFNLYEISADGAEAKRLTRGNFDDFAPKFLPDGDVIFISTRRGGWHRCGTPGCEVYTLARMQADGQNIQVLSFHETQEWDPVVLHDGRVVYTRWDYVDRHAVHYQQLWVTRPDGTNPAIFYGNNTLNPVGVWETRPVPGSDKVIATAAPHHGMTAGSIILIDTSKGMDDLEPLTRLTPEVPFPESEAVLLPHWRSELRPDPPAVTPEMERWPGQCYKNPWAFSEKLFLAAYSFDPLIGEPKGNFANTFGIYLVDASGNKELLYRDLNISSLSPLSMQPRKNPPVLPSALQPDAAPEGTFYLQDVYESDPRLPEEKITHLRLVQVLPKSTPGANNPTVGAANASPGRQVLGTVPVEEDGSAYFKAPSGIGIAFQALDASGQAVQVMRSLTYLQPGENVSCVGCHETRSSTPPTVSVRSQALRRAPSEITPAPDGSRPLSYPILVQPVLDKHCLSCHDAEATQSELKLTGAPEGRYTQSYNALIPHVSFSYWGRGQFPAGNCEPGTQPGFFGARGSHLTQLLLNGHYDVKLDKDEWERLITWMDANALFYGTFNKKDQARQQMAERIAGPELE